MELARTHGRNTASLASLFEFEKAASACILGCREGFVHYVVLDNLAQCGSRRGTAPSVSTDLFKRPPLSHYGPALPLNSCPDRIRRPVICSVDGSPDTQSRCRISYGEVRGTSPEIHARFGQVEDNRRLKGWCIHRLSKFVVWKV
jgi:hypothetical protein